jgi:hypothetical protein
MNLALLGGPNENVPGVGEPQEQLTAGTQPGALNHVLRQE